jgi:uncharacterized protein
MLNTDFVTGAPNWLDVAGPDTDASAAFYRGVFDWDFQSAGPDAGGYGFFQKDGKTVAALGPLTEEGASPSWTVYFRTSDADATARAVEQGGGTVRSEAFDVMDAGRMACFTDPQGAQFSVWQPGSVRGLDSTSDTNALCWTELHTGDTPAALSFYRSLFGWRAQEMPGPEMTYTVLSTADGELEDASFGGIAPVRDGEGTRWLAYFAVENADDIVSRVETNGGIVRMPATDAPDIGRMAWFTDPFGAYFAVIKPQPPRS